MTVSENPGASERTGMERWILGMSPGKGSSKRAAFLYSLAPAALLAVCLLVILDVHLESADPPPAPAAKELQFDYFHIPAIDYRPRINVLFSKESSRFGISCADLRDPRNPKRPKLLTRDERGLTNNTCIWAEGYQYLFGHELPGMCYVTENGKLQKNVQIADTAWQSVMELQREKIRVTQTVRILVGEQTRLLDTALVRYQVANLDSKPHTVGIRMLLDTYIGANDGVPFLIPPTETTKGYMVDGMKVFEQKDVPEFIRAVESPQADATVAELDLKLARSLEPVHRLVICRMPDGSQARWDWKYTPMNQPPEREKDSCVVLYWDRVNMNPGERREMGFTYGLGRIGTDCSCCMAPAGNLRLMTNGSLKRGKTFVVTAYVQGGTGSQIALQLPQGLQLVDANVLQPVPAPPNNDPQAYSQVSWRVKSTTPGTYEIAVEHSTIGTAKVKVNIVESSIFE